MTRAVARMLDDHRLHLHDGPIDLVIEADGPPEAVHRARAAAVRRFAGILDELCSELPLLRSAARPHAPPEGPIARLMWRSVLPYAEQTFVTPMAAVAGAVADGVLNVMLASGSLSRAYVNNGGDIAVGLTPGTFWRVGLVDRPDRPSLFGSTTLSHGSGVGGIATSGWRGRSFSFGIADAVTVLATDAAAADAAATIIANAVDLPGHPAISRVPASDLQPDSDLGSRRVTRAVGPLTPSEIGEALDSGAARATDILRRGHILAAALHLAGATCVVGDAGDWTVSAIDDARRLTMEREALAG